MSDGVAVIIGLGIGILVAGPVLIVYRRELVQRIGELFRGSEATERMDNPSVLSPGLSSLMMLVVFGTAAVSALYGLLSHAGVFVATGVFIAAFTGLVVLATKARRS